MKRLFAVLAVINLLSLVATFTVGALSWSNNGLHSADARHIYLLHFNCGLFAVLVNLAVHSLVFIYFLGTGRWVKEVALAYELPDVPLPRLTRELKRRTFPPALFAMLIPIATAAAGSGVQMAQWPPLLHFCLALATLAINIWAYRIEYRNIATNSGIIDSVMLEVDRIRAAHNLCSNAEALEQEAKH